MDKTFTLIDLQYYLREIRIHERKSDRIMAVKDGPSQSTIQNLLRYSGALNVMKTSTVGNIYQLTN